MNYFYEEYAQDRKRYRVPGIVEEIIDGIHLDIYQNRPHTLTEIFYTSVKRDPNHEAIVYDHQRISYGELAQRVNDVAFSWQKQYGIQKGDRIAIILRNTPEFVISFFASSQIGAISVPTNTRLKTPELEYVLKDCQPSLIITEPELWERVTPIRGQLPNLRAIFISSPDRISGAVPFSELSRQQAPEKIRVSLTEEDPNSIIYTSGTTGLPKGAILCHRNFIANSMNCQALCHLGPEDRLLLMAPMFHVTALNSQLIKIIHAGATGILMRAFKTEDILNVVEREKITEMTGVPAMYTMILQSPGLEGRDLGSLKYCGYGGSAAPVELIHQLKSRFPNWRLRNVYGMTEASSWVTMLPHEETTVRADSVGLPVPVVRLRIVDEQQQNVPQGEVGEILVKGPNVFKGYWKNPKATAAALKEGWFLTGDLGRFDAEGYLYVVDRKKEMIIRGGENIYCLEVENVLYQHPKVAEAAVTGAPDPVYGEIVMAALVLKKNESLTPEEVQEFCKRFLADYKVPKRVKFLDALPRNSAGKVLKKEL